MCENESAHLSSASSGGRAGGATASGEEEEESRSMAEEEEIVLPIGRRGSEKICRTFHGETTPPSFRRVVRSKVSTPPPRGRTEISGFLGRKKLCCFNLLLNHYLQRRL